MSAESTFSCLSAITQRYDILPPRSRVQKRKLAPFASSVRFGDLLDPSSYPSPPMSRPPSPPKSLASELPAGTSRAFSAVSTAEQGPVTTFAPPLATTLPTSAPPVSTPLSAQPTSTAAYGTTVSATPSLPAWQSGQPGGSSVMTAASTRPGDSTVVSQPVRGGRRSKAHVASACINCKRAHLSCDVQRPCARCVASGKQDTCIDVQHKKRGRPRLREEGDFGVQQMIPEQSSLQTSALAGPSQTPARPIAGTRHRRAESFRSLMSQTSDDSPSYTASTPGYGGQAMLQSPYSAQQPPTSGGDRSGGNVATALLTTDFAIIRANRPFEHIMFGGRDVRGRHISEIAASADTESFINIRNRLRAEREAREPAYMPPIMQPGPDPVLGISEAEVDQYTQGFSDRTYLWTHAQVGMAAETFPARVRLAKASTYFVVVTLPSFRPVEQMPVQPLGYPGQVLFGPPLQAPAQYLSSRQDSAIQYAALPTMAYSLPGAMPIAQGPTSAGQSTSSRTYPPQQPGMPYHQQMYPVYPPAAPAPATPRLSVAEPPTDTTAFTPRSLPIDTTQSMGTAALQLPPITGSPAAGQPGAQSMEEGSDDDEAEGSSLRSPRKRRRMGIDEVLQR